MPKDCFVIMPFSATSEIHTSLYWDQFFSNFIKPSIEKFGYSCSRSTAKPSNIIKDIIYNLGNTDLVIAVLTDLNPNVWYELGNRHALKKGTVMMIENGQELPFDISSYGVIKYDDKITGNADFENKLRDFIQRIETEKQADSPALDFLNKQDSRDLKKKDVFHNKRILWVDDIPSNNEDIVGCFRQNGVKFDIALSTEQALNYLTKESYDIVISDIGRGKEYDAGIRMIREIRRRFGHPGNIWIFSSEGAINHYGNRLIREGAVFITNDARKLMIRMLYELSL
jgi:CheY-like chemotaxis protein